MGSKKFNWVSFFFMLLSIILIIFLISLFFGVKIPNLKGVNKIVVNSNNEFIEINSNCFELGGYDDISGLRPYEKFIYLNECNKYCVEKTDIKNGILWETKEYECRDNKLYCKCGIR